MLEKNLIEFCCNLKLEKYNIMVWYGKELLVNTKLLDLRYV
jgi:hypothetical protein